MDDDKLHLSNKTVENDEYLLVLKPSEEDPLFEIKKKLLEDKGFEPQGHVVLKSSTSCPDWPTKIMEILLERAKIICSDEIELYFGGVDTNSSGVLYNPRIELEALHSILSLIDKTLSSGNHALTSILQDLRDVCIDMIKELGGKIRLETRIVTDFSCDNERCLLQWGESSGVQRKLEPIHIEGEKANVQYVFFFLKKICCIIDGIDVEGAGRGAIATEDLKVGDIALEIPVSVIISEELVHKSDMFPILKKIDGISSETMLLLWSMKEKHNRYSKFKFFFDALPEVFNTGLSFGINAIMALDGTLLLDEIVQAKEHLRNQYDELFPPLCNDHPDIFPAELYTWEQFLWACGLWYSNGMKIMFTDGQLQTCLVPIAGFLNHSLCPHILHYGRVDSATNSLKFPLSRPCNLGEECYLSYGKFSSSHLVTFYGFLPQGENPYDVISLDIDSNEAVCFEDGCHMSSWTNHMVRGTWLSKNHELFHYGLPSPLLDHFRRACSPVIQTDVHNLETELKILEDLCSTFEDMLETLGEINPDDSTTWDVKLAVRFKDLQRKIVSSIVTSCYSGRRLVEYETRMAHTSKISRSIIQPGHSENVETSGDGLHRS
ncbi:uncharacterized protein LOC130753520 isoform X2 [Actinidia eriantha]|uniref:uncharacterized protein LOC130753379 isoform X2 n=1 Tax=Actinidia eriantha TaxID=165200 RepID=UPI00258ABB5A|nr:uncharacterized protein LOC130753379 isoform X2 [Actinidia eriantha]XP_057463635.1 uncharacterized protein LOC130753520 isoform X2 [Actinidia eriantha]